MALFDPFKALTTGLRFVLAYLLLTPIFWLLDIWFGIEIRIAFLEDPAWKSLYYSIVFASGITCYFLPRWIAIVAFAESTLNIFIHIFSFILPVLTLPAQVMAGNSVSPDITANHILSFALVGMIMVMSFHSAIDGLRNEQ